MKPSLETNRMRARPMTPGDVDSLMGIFSDPVAIYKNTY